MKGEVSVDVRGEGASASLMNEFRFKKRVHMRKPATLIHKAHSQANALSNGDGRDNDVEREK